jgi:carbonic anhydrase
MTLKAVPKPIGNELNTKRANDSADASAWLPEDALYSAYEEMKDTPPVKAMVVAWYVPGSKPGTLSLRMRLFCEGICEGDSLAGAIFQRLTKDPE